jgi:hypothetical protein
LRARLFRGLAAVIGVVLVIVAVAWQLAIEPALRDGVARSQLEVARRAADQIGHFLDHRVGELSAAAEIGRLWEGPPDRQRKVLYRLLKLSPPIEEVALVDAAGSRGLPSLPEPPLRSGRPGHEHSLGALPSRHERGRPHR